jgi:hypothetical protein
MASSSTTASPMPGHGNAPSRLLSSNAIRPPTGPFNDGEFPDCPATRSSNSAPASRRLFGRPSRPSMAQERHVKHCTMRDIALSAFPHSSLDSNEPDCATFAIWTSRSGRGHEQFHAGRQPEGGRSQGVESRSLCRRLLALSPGTAAPDPHGPGATTTERLTQCRTRFSNCRLPACGSGWLRGLVALKTLIELG